MGCPSKPRVQPSHTVSDVQYHNRHGTARPPAARPTHDARTERGATFRLCRASPLNGKQHVGTSGDSHRSCDRETDGLQHVTAATDCRRDVIGPNTLKERPETERRFLSLQKNLHNKPEGADLETLRR